MFSRLDRNGDGAISRAEAGNPRWFDQIDQNQNGTIERKELERIRAFLQRRAAPATSETPAATAAPVVPPEEIKALTSGPEVLHPGEAGIGRQIADLRFTDLNGRSHRLGELAAPRGVVVAMTSATCPVSKRYLPSLERLEDDLAKRGLALVLINPFASETVAEIREQLHGHSFAAPYVRDTDRTVAAALQARATTEVFLIDSTRTLIYRGALDDQYGLDYNLPAPRHNYLLDAVAALEHKQRPRIEATAAPGCELDIPSPTATTLAQPITYHRDIARILQQNCVECHRDGGIAPFALDSESAVKDRVRAIKRVISEGTMPPWFAAPAENGQRSPWANDRSLSARDEADLLAWIGSPDRPLGNPADAPVPRAYPEDWSIGKPDLVLTLSRAYEIPATGFMPYQFDFVETEITEDTWVTGYEILPSARDVVHHVIVNVHEPGTPIRQRDEATGFWAAYVPGNGANVYPEGFARKLPAGARVSFQIHYTPSGKATTERLRLGLVFAKTPPRYEVKTIAVSNRRLSIPPGVAAHEETTVRMAPFDLPVTSFIAHMHVRGKSFKYEVTYPDGKHEVLLDIPRYDFNWQLRYELKEPKLIPRGSEVRITALYDNSIGNRANPDPTRTVKWGPQTYDEMMIGYLEYFQPVAGIQLANR